MTFDSANKLLLMFWPSLNLIPSDLVRDTPSEPAKSTKLISDVLVQRRLVWVQVEVISKLILNTE